MGVAKGAIEILSSDDEEGKARSPVDYSEVEVEVEVKTAQEKRREEEECCVLDADPSETAALDLMRDLADLGRICRRRQGDDDLAVIAERGQVACRDYPHSRHLCAQYPFQKTTHESCCRLCYCYICDIAAPCSNWKGISGHCHASDQEKKWKDMRVARRPVIVKKVATTT